MFSTKLGLVAQRRKPECQVKVRALNLAARWPQLVCTGLFLFLYPPPPPPPLRRVIFATTALLPWRCVGLCTRRPWTLWRQPCSLLARFRMFMYSSGLPRSLKVLRFLVSSVFPGSAQHYNEDFFLSLLPPPDLRLEGCCFLLHVFVLQLDSSGGHKDTRGLMDVMCSAQSSHNLRFSVSH